MTTMMAAFQPVIDQVLAEREAAARKALIVTKTLNTKGNLTASARWNRALAEAQADVLELRRRARAYQKGGRR